VLNGIINENIKAKIPKHVAFPTPKRNISLGAIDTIINVPIAMQKMANPKSPSSMFNLDLMAGI